MADPVQTPPATPPANDPNGGNNLQQQQQAPQAQPGNNPAPAPIIMSQEQFDQRYGEKLTALEKELGLEPGALKDPASLRERIGQKKPPAPAPSSDPLSGAELRLAKMEALMLAKVPSERIPGLLSRVQGKSKAEIEADIQQMIADGFLVIEKPAAAQPQQQGPPSAAQGAGNPGVPGNGAGPKVWTKQEVLDLQKSNPDEYRKHRLEIMDQMAKGLVK